MKSAIGIVCIAGVNAQVPWQALAPSEESIDGFSPAQKHHAATTYSKPKKYYEPKDAKPTVRMIRRPKWPLLHPGKSYIPAAKTVWYRSVRYLYSDLRYVRHRASNGKTAFRAWFTTGHPRFEQDSQHQMSRRQNAQSVLQVSG